MHQSSFKGKKGSQRKKVARAAAKKSNEVRSYTCTVCGQPVLKKNACGSGESERASGLGKFKCRCGGKTVKVVITQRGVPSAEKVAA